MPRSNPDSRTCRQRSGCFSSRNISLNKRMLYPQTGIRVTDKLCSFTPESHSNPYDSPMITEFELFDRFYLLIFYFGKFSTWICRLPYTWSLSEPSRLSFWLFYGWGVKKGKWKYSVNHYSHNKNVNRNIFSSQRMSLWECQYCFLRL